MLTEMDIIPGSGGAGTGDHSLIQMFQWNQRGLRIISASFLPDEDHFTFQTEWMGCMILARDIDNQLSWIRGLSVNYYKIHFALLFRQFNSVAFTQEERDTLAQNVVDFSLAQQQGFVDAYLEEFNTYHRDQNDMIRLLKGCRQHYRAQITRVMRNRNIVRADEEGTFKRMCMGLLDKVVPGGPTQEEKTDELRRHFPQAKRWIDWWMMADVSAMLFPAQRPQHKDTPDGDDELPETSNAQESMHRLYYMISEGRTSVLVGMVQLYSFVKVLEEDYNSVMRGVSIEYAQSMGWDKKRKRAAAPPKASTKETRHESVNDGRPPDTTATLIPDLNNPKAKLGPRKGSQNIDRNQRSTYPSYHASSKPHLRNRCWLAAALECVYALYSPLWLRGSTGNGNTLFHTVVKHLATRATYELTRSGSIRGMLTKAETTIFNHVNSILPQSFVSGEFMKHQETVVS
ncbi:hypothetical protein PSTG_12470 [Puccinia striiformis f. sp. tritici PST-78]|uniref:Uncharacterized protein n=1 Tax=Puccinia striiformis f. sp. tritici PST-78 TaxID=1165861 RepID=A0A0L0V4D8_9BASI|nr:hypothetical protein PSTG_12470 [Puccinia striiformis f. sp. tritici PST-78]